MPGDDEEIKAHVKEAEAIIEKEADQWDDDHPIVERAPTSEEQTEPPETKDAADLQMDTVGSLTNGEKSSTPINSDDTNMHGTATSNGDRKDSEPSEALKDPGDDGGEEIVEGGEEDTVIY